VCSEARQKGGRHVRTGPSAFLHDESLLVDTPAEIAYQLNRSRIEQIDYLLFTHLDPDHVEGFRVVEQIALDFRTWEAYPDKGISLLLPDALRERFGSLQSAYGPLLDYYVNSGFVTCIPFQETLQVGNLHITAIPVDRGDQESFIYVFERDHRRLVYAPCDIKPFPEERKEVRHADLLVIQPGIFENGLKHDFVYPPDHISRTTLYTAEETVELSMRIGAKKVLFTHLEEYWNRGYDDYREMEEKFENVRFAYDGMQVSI